MLILFSMLLYVTVKILNDLTFSNSDYRMIRVLVEIKMNTKPVNERKDYHTMVLEALLFYNIAQKYNVFAIYMLTDKPVISRNLHKGFYNLVEFKQKQTISPQRSYLLISGIKYISQR